MKYSLYIFLLFLVSCKPEPYKPTTSEFLYNNKTNYTVDLIRYITINGNANSYSYGYKMNKGESIRINQQQEEFLLASVLDSVEIIFDNTKKVVFRKNDEQSNPSLWDVSPVRTSSYMLQENGEVASYTIDNKIYDLAK